MNTSTSRALRRLAVAALLPLAALAASCSSAPPATPNPTCPALQAGTWSGSWASATYNEIGGQVLAQLVATTTSVGGTFTLYGSVLGEPTVITGTISCNKVEAITADGITLSGTINASGDAMSGTYTLRTPSDTGSFDIERMELVL